MEPEKIHPYDMHELLGTCTDVFIRHSSEPNSRTIVEINGKEYIQTVSVEPKTTWRP